MRSSFSARPGSEKPRFFVGRAIGPKRRGCISASVRIPAAAGLPPRYPLGQLLEALLAASFARGDPPTERLQRVVATLTGAGAPDTYAVAAPQIADALEEVGRYGSLAIFLDDYHWAPRDGIELLIAVLRVLETPVCFVASARLHGLGEEATNALPEPSADLWVEHLEIRGLEPSAVTAVAGSILGGEVMPSLADALYTRTLGNPLFLTETLQTWRTDGILRMTGGYWGLDRDAAPAHARSLREMITARLIQMDPIHPPSFVRLPRSAAMRTSMNSQPSARSNPASSSR